MAARGYIADETIATSVYLARELGRPLLVEGDAGVGKTEIAKVWAELAGTDLIRLQCYEGLDVSTALYEWNYPRQLLRVRMSEAAGQADGALEEAIFTRAYLLERPILRAITREAGPAVLLIDEIDRADEAFEALLLEVLSDFQVTIPELGAITATHVPHVVLTSNGSREIGDALRRRCLYLHLGHPDVDKEIAILRARVPGASEALAGEIARFMASVRSRDLVRRPGVAETIDWARALSRQHAQYLDPDMVEATLGCVIKDHHDRKALPPDDVGELVAAARGASAR
jgi:MoxR-like ATPase